MSWLDFCQDYRVPFKHVKENIQILCPWCGPERDTSMHLGLHLHSSKWGCWEDKAHGSKSPLRLIMRLTGCDWEGARSLANRYFEHGWYIPVQERVEHEAPTVPESFMKFKKYTSYVKELQKKFAKYLEKRGIDPDWAGERYDLRWCISGDYAGRIVIPMVERNIWRAWTARDVGSSKLRYRAGEIPPGDFLFDVDGLQGGDVLLVVEGVFDAMSVKMCFIPGLDVTSFSGKRISDRQTLLLAEVSPQYGKVVICLDEAVYGSSLAEAYSLESYVPNVVARSPTRKDFGDTARRELRTELENLIRSVA